MEPGATTSCQDSDAEHEFNIMSVSKSFMFALVCNEIGNLASRGA